MLRVPERMGGTNSVNEIRVQAQVLLAHVGRLKYAAIEDTCQFLEDNVLSDSELWKLSVISST